MKSGNCPCRSNGDVFLKLVHAAILLLLVLNLNISQSRLLRSGSIVHSAHAQQATPTKAPEDMDDDDDGKSNANDPDDDDDGTPDKDDDDHDTDKDGKPDAGDKDDDNDGTPDTNDTDDDNDGIPDTNDDEHPDASKSGKPDSNDDLQAKMFNAGAVVAVGAGAAVLLGITTMRAR